MRYRPGYPPEVMRLLETECNLTPQALVADVASGTGLWTRHLLENGNRVFAVEPNAEMREAGQRLLASFPKLVSVAGRAEATTLPDRSVDFVTAAQAAHWFERDKARQEFVRILKPHGWCVLVWNERRTDSTPFLRDYEKLLQAYGTDYTKVRHENTTASIGTFFAPSPFRQRVFELRQEFDYPGLEGRLLSSSYAPQRQHPECQPMLRELREIFDNYQNNGGVFVDYNTRVYYGKLD